LINCNSKDIYIIIKDLYLNKKCYSTEISTEFFFINAVHLFSTSIIITNISWAPNQNQNYHQIRRIY